MRGNESSFKVNICYKMIEAFVFVLDIHCVSVLSVWNTSSCIMFSWVYYCGMFSKCCSSSNMSLVGDVNWSFIGLTVEKKKSPVSLSQSPALFCCLFVFCPALNKCILIPPNNTQPLIGPPTPLISNEQICPCFLSTNDYSGCTLKVKSRSLINWPGCFW